MQGDQILSCPKTRKQHPSWLQILNFVLLTSAAVFNLKSKKISPQANKTLKCYHQLRMKHPEKISHSCPAVTGAHDLD